MATENLKYVIEARETASKKIRQLRRELEKLGGPKAVKSQQEIRKLTRQVNQLSGAAGKSKPIFSKFIKGIAAGNIIANAATKAMSLLTAGVKEVGQAVLVAARTEVLNTTLEQMAKTANVTKVEIQGLKEEIKALGITEQDAIGVLQRFMQAELDVADAAKVARLAQDAAVIAGVNSSEAAIQITDAINKGFPRLLKQFGIMVNLVQVNKEYAAELGKTANELTAQEKKQGLLNATLKQGESLTGLYEAAMRKAGKQLTSLPRLFQDAQNALGEHFIPELGLLVSVAGDALKIIKDLAQSTESATAEFFAAGKKMETQADQVLALAKSYDDLTAGQELSAEEQIKLNGIIDRLAILMPTAITKWTEYGEAIEFSTDKIRANIDQQRALFRVQQADKIDKWKDAIDGLRTKIDEATVSIENQQAPVATMNQGIRSINRGIDEEGLLENIAEWNATINDLVVSLGLGFDAINDYDRAVRVLGQDQADMLLAFQTTSRAATASNTPVDGAKDSVTELGGAIGLTTKQLQLMAPPTQIMTDELTELKLSAKATAAALPEVGRAANDAGNTGAEAMDLYTFSVETAVDATTALIEAAKQGDLTFGKMLKTLSGFVPGVGGAVLGLFGSLLPFDDPVNDTRLVNENRRIAGFMAKGIAQAGAGAQQQTTTNNYYVVSSQEAIPSAPEDMSRFIEEQISDGFIQIEGA